VTWVDHFGNLQLAATQLDAQKAGIPATGNIELVVRTQYAGAPEDPLPPPLVPDRVQLRYVDAFGKLKQGEFGLLVDSNGHLAVVCGEASAAKWLNISAGELVVLSW
jgi:S-adenosylmethionine hydrolase